MKLPTRLGLFIPLLALILLGGCKDSGTEPQDTPAPVVPPGGTTISFSQRVRPIFQRQGCAGCHGGSGGLTVGTVAQLLAGGDHGPAIVAGQADNSNLIKKVLASPPFGSRMPVGGPYLPDTTIAVLRTWINEGALNN